MVRGGLRFWLLVELSLCIRFLDFLLSFEFNLFLRGLKGIIFVGGVLIRSFLFCFLIRELELRLVMRVGEDVCLWLFA